MFRLVLACLFGAAISSISATAYAEPSAADRDSARTLMNEGDRRMEARDAKGALDSYAAAHAIMGVPTTGAATASAHLELGQVVEARDLCLAVQRYPKAANEPAAFGAARLRCDGLLGQIAGRAASLRIEVKGLAAGITPTITIDGGPVPFAALKVPRKVNPGDHVIVGSAPGHADTAITVAVVEGSTREVTLDFGAGGPRSGPVSGGSASASGQTTGLGAASASSGSPRRGPGAPAVAAFAIGATGLAVGGITGALSLSKASAAKADCVGNVCPTRNRDDADSARTFGNVSNVGFAVGAVGVVVGAVLWAVGKNETPSSTRASLGLGTAAIEGTF